MKTYKKGFKSTSRERRYRRFSESFKIQKVREIEQGKVKVIELCKAYEVTSTAVYKWIEKYSSQQRPERTIVESKSDTQKILALQKRIADLERILGQKQIQLDFHKKMIEIAEKEFGIDIKKKSKGKR